MIAVTGAGGQLGRTVLAALRRRGIPGLGFDRHELNIADRMLSFRISGLMFLTALLTVLHIRLLTMPKITPGMPLRLMQPRQNF